MLEEIIKLVEIKKKDFEYFYSLLEKDFCFAERKVKEDELKSLENKSFKPCFICDENKIVGYFCYWDFEDFIFGEHLAILEKIRDKGFGTKFLKEFLSKIKKPFVFEIEKPADEQSIKRKRFYERFGFTFNDFDYCQPSYHKANDGVPMIFVSYPEKLTRKRFLQISNIIKEKVYENV